MRIGNGFDVHRLVSGRPLILGGVRISYKQGLLGHSDADVLLHALCDALLGAAGMGDIGQHFPPTDARFAGKDSREFVRAVLNKLEQADFKVENVDCTIIAEHPKLAPHIPQMVKNIAADLRIESDRVNIKATTTEGLGLCGRGEGIAAMACALIS